MTTKFKWVCNSDDGYFEDSEKDNHKVFDTQEECYEDMREAAINKIFWNTDWNDVHEDCEVLKDENGIEYSTGSLGTDGNVRGDNWGIGYAIQFHPQMIQHHSYSGLYTYRIVPIIGKNNLKWTDFWGSEAKYDIAEDCELLYELKFGKSCVLWTADVEPVETPSDDLKTRPDEYSTHGFTDDFEEWGIEITKDAIKHGCKNVNEIMKFIKKVLTRG